VPFPLCPGQDRKEWQKSYLQIRQVRPDFVLSTTKHFEAREEISCGEARKYRDDPRLEDEATVDPTPSPARE